MLLPGKTGWEVLHNLKTSPMTATIPVVIVSVIDERKMGLAMGAAEYLLKPLTRAKLLATMQQVIPRPAVRE